MKSFKITTAIIGLTMLFLAFASSAFAVGVSPLRVELKAKPGETIEASLQAFNSEDKEQVVVLTKGDFIVDQTEDLKFMNERDPNNKYSLMDWIELPEENTTVEAKGGAEVKYKIHVPEDAKSQSYYGVVFVSTKDPEVIETPIGVGVTTNVAQLILLEVEGDLKTDITASDFKLDQKASNVKFLTSIENNGNIHDAAQGRIIITDKKLNILEELGFNKEKHNSLPEAPKTFVTPWDKFSDYQKGVYYAYLDIKDEANTPHYAELKFRINDDGNIDTLDLNMGRSYEEALKIHSATPLIPIIILLAAVLIAAIATKFCCKKKYKK